MTSVDSSSSATARVAAGPASASVPAGAPVPVGAPVDEFEGRACAPIALDADIQAFLGADGGTSAGSTPEVVFARVAELCVASLARACTIELVTSDSPFHRICRPDRAGGEAPESAAAPSPQFRRLLDEGTDLITSPEEATLAIAGGAAGQAYLGALSFARIDDTGADVRLARILISRAGQLIDHDQLTRALPAAVARADNLERALLSNRTIGVAMGILMVTRRLTEPAAFDRLRTASQNSNRKLRDVAEDVMLTGVLDEAVSAPRRRESAGPKEREGHRPT